jgi:cyclopropane-fatty-acyl-phospholipid synthase
MSADKLINPEFVSSRSFAISSALDGFCRNMLFKKLSGLKTGRIEFREHLPTGVFTHVCGQEDAPSDLRAQVVIHRKQAYSRIALGGSIGTAESYVDSDWDCDNLTGLIRIFVSNRDTLLALDGGLGAVLAPLQRLAHRLNGNTIRGAQANIQAHYDLGNDFFRLFLDDTWMYSCGIFTAPETTLEEASVEKIDRICKKLNLSTSDHVVEIGTGWGGFAIHAATQYGCKVTTTTISKEQYQFALQKVEELGLSDRIEVLLQDYRLLQGKFDKLVSIEMIEAVGLKNLDTYFAKCSSLLKPNGQMVIQGITIRDQYYEYAKKNVDFIQLYIFPGSGIPSLKSINESISGVTDLSIFHQEEIGPHYATTLRHWSERLKEKKDQITALGYPSELYRLWQYYFSYCEGGFAERAIGCSQILFTKPECRRAPLLGNIKETKR